MSFLSFNDLFAGWARSRPIKRHFCRLVCVAALSGLPSAHAARPMMIDDARIVDNKAYQLETWFNRYRKSTEYWAYNALTVTDNLEITVGGAHTWGEDNLSRMTHQVIQFKSLYKPLQTNDWTWGVVLGNTRYPVAPGGSSASDVYLYAPVSWSICDDCVVLHANLGWLREKNLGEKNLTDHGWERTPTRHRHRATWGLSAEIQLNGTNWLVAESFGQGKEKPFYQFGLRHWIVYNRLQLDATYGNRLNSMSGQEGWFSVGLRYLSPPFLP